MAFKLRKYQKHIIAKIRNIYKESPKAFLQMVTGSGKTITAFEIVLQEFKKTQKPIKVAWTAHQTGLIEQSYTDLLEFLEIPFDRNNLPKDLVYTYEGITFLFDTWQTLRNSTEKFDMLIVDECHYGSSLNKGEDKRDHKSLRKVLKLAPKHLYVSATPWNLNMELFEELFDQKHKVIRSDRVAIYTMEEAKKDGFLCDMSFCVVQSVDTLEIKRIESGETKNSGKLSSMEESSKFIEKHQVSIKHVNSIKKLRQATLYSLLDVYFAREAKGRTLPPTLVFCKTRSGQDETLCLSNVVKTFKKRAKSHFGKNFNIGKTFIDYVASDVSDSNKKIQEFKEGNINILCVVGMAREGFNYKPLTVGIDLNPSYNNIRLATQKVGRFLRPSEGKTKARYYYADTLENYVKENGVTKELSEEIKNQDIRNALALANDVAPESLEQDDIEALAGPLTTLAQFSRALGENGEEAQLQVQGQSILPTIGPNGAEKKVRVTEVGFLISDAENTNPEQNIRVENLFGGLKTVVGTRDPDGKKEQLLKLATEGKDKPRYDNPEHKEMWRALMKYTIKSEPTFDSIFTLQIHTLRPDWFRDTETSKLQLLQLAIKGAKKPRAKTHNKKERSLGQKLQKYLNPNVTEYDPVFKKKIGEINPEWLLSRTDASLRRMLKKMPKTVVFKNNQEWKGVDHTYVFIDEEFGEFTGIPTNLMGRSWKNGLTGHRKHFDKKLSARLSKKVRRSDGKIFKSIREATASLGNKSTVDQALRLNVRAGGYYWAYVDEDEE